jgi:hypothetical protein
MQPEGWDFGLLPGELTGTSAGIGRCQLHLVGVGIGFFKTAMRLVRRHYSEPPWFERFHVRFYPRAISVPQIAVSKVLGFSD